MNGTGTDAFRQVWLGDFEFHQPEGNLPEPICAVFRQYPTGPTLRLWADELAAAGGPPFGIGDDTLFIAYYASAEFGCFLSLGWPLPSRILDLFTEFRCHTNGLPVPCGSGLLGAMAYYGLDVMGASEKDAMRGLAIRGGPFSDSERQALLDYCQEDVDSLGRLLPAMLPKIDWGPGLLRGRSMAAAARMERAGVPVDTGTLNALRADWDAIKGHLVEAVDNDYGVYVSQGETAPPRFSSCRWAEYLARNDIPWPRLESGALDLSDDTFRQMARQYPEVAPIRELRHTLSQLRLNDLAVGSDGRNRCLLSAFRARTGRFQPSNSRYIFGPSAWLRALIQPEPSRAVAYADWEQQEFGIAAALSGDHRMLDAYRSGDPYLAFAKQAGAVPSDATKQSHPREREQFKVCALAVQYGMSACSLAESLGVPEAQGRHLLELHRQTYPDFWRWSEAAVSHAMLYGRLYTVFGWEIRVGQDVNPRSLANFPMQANGAEMLRLACCLATERGIQVCAPVHDAVLVEGPEDDIDAVVRKTQAAMAEASRAVLDGFELRTEAKVVTWPERYLDPRGEKMWTTIMGILNTLDPPQEIGASGASEDKRL